jgi:hypothetical protein
LKDRLEQIAKQGQSAYKEVYRRAKVNIKKISFIHFKFIVITSFKQIDTTIISVRGDATESNLAKRCCCATKNSR